MKRAIRSLATLTLLIGGTAQVSAGFLSVVNPGFEDINSFQQPVGWTTSGDFTAYDNNLGGQLLPPAGVDIGSASGLEGSPGGASQVIAGYAIQPNTTYTLQLLVGGRLDSGNHGFGGSLIALEDATTSNVLASYELDRGTGPSPLNGVFEWQTVSFSTDPAGGAIGHQLEIVLQGLGQIVIVQGLGTGGQTWFDNVSLTASTTAANAPEPSTLVMSSIMLGMFGTIWFCKRLTRPAQAV